jgi:hypothetical protein
MKKTATVEKKSYPQQQGTGRERGKASSDNRKRLQSWPDIEDSTLLMMKVSQARPDIVVLSTANPVIKSSQGQHHIVDSTFKKRFGQRRGVRPMRGASR